MAASVDGLVVRNNRFVSPLTEVAPDTGASYKIPKDAVVWIAKSTDVKYEDSNKIEKLGAFVNEQVILK